MSFPFVDATDAVRLSSSTRQVVRRFQEMNGLNVILAGASVRSLAESAVRDGLKPLCIDMFGDEDLRQLLQRSFGTTDNLIVVERFSDIPGMICGFGGNVPLIAVGGIENDFDVMTQIRSQRLVCGPSATVIQELRDPRILFPVLHDGGCEKPRCVFDSVLADPNTRWLRKSINTAGGQGVQDFDSTLLNRQSYLTDGQYLQEFIDGVPMSATFCCSDTGLHLIGCALQLSGVAGLHAPPFWFCGNAGPATVCCEVQDQFLRIGECIAKHWPIRGLFGVDVIVRDRRVFVLEVNPRLTASHELHELGRRDLAGHVAQQLTAYGQHAEFVPPSAGVAPSQSAIVRLVVYADRDTRVSAATQSALLKLCRHDADPLPEVWLADIPALETEVLQGTPFCSVYCSLHKPRPFSAGRISTSGLFSQQVLDSLANMASEIQRIFELLK